MEWDCDLIIRLTINFTLHEMICSLGTVIYFLLNLIQRPNFEFKALNTKKKKKKKKKER